MTFNYEQSLWGRGQATLRWSDPASFRLRQASSALKFLPPGSRVLEIGCGVGQFIRGIRAIRPDLVCAGCDISQAAIAAAAGYADGVAYTLCTNTLPYNDGSFDAVVVFDVLEHVEDVAQTVSEMSRVLKVGGRAHCFVPCEGDLLSGWHLLDQLGLKRSLTKKYAGHLTYFSRASLRAALQKYFTVIRTRYSEHFLGQLVGIAAFVLLHRAAKRHGGGQINNETYFGEKSGVARKLVNSLLYLESRCLSRLPSPNVHITLEKKI